MSLLSQLFLPLTISTAMVLLTVATHGLGLVLLARAVAGEQHEERLHHVAPISLRGAAFTLLTVVSLFVLHGIEIWSYAALYIAIDAFQHFEEALYFSTVSYAAIGYGDTHLPAAWRLLGAIEGVNGVILLGWSTAFFVNLLMRLRR
ncbi:MAG: ion channel [Novosphingobium sp.]|nr:ion channel [Novosphingobium sp.]